MHLEVGVCEAQACRTWKGNKRLLLWVHIVGLVTDYPKRVASDTQN